MKRVVALALWLALAGGCATPRGGYYQDDGPHSRPRDVSRVPDAVPRNEPLSASGNRPYAVFGVSYRPLSSARNYQERGVASWYGKKFHGRRTSSGEPYDMYRMTAAHKTLPLPSFARVRNLANGRNVIVRINDRGPFLHNRLIDLSYAAAHRLGIVGTGTGIVEVTGLTPGEPEAVSVARGQAPDSTVAATESPRLFLQAGAFASRANAVSLSERLRQGGISLVAVQDGERDGTPIFRVRIGPLPSVDDSDRMAARVQSLGLPNPVIVVVP